MPPKCHGAGSPSFKARHQPSLLDVFGVTPMCVKYTTLRRCVGCDACDDCNDDDGADDDDDDVDTDGARRCMQHYITRTSP